MKNYFLFSTKREQLVLKITVLITTLLPMEWLLRVNYFFAKYMSKNFGHSFARNMVSMIEERKKG